MYSVFVRTALAVCHHALAKLGQFMASELGQSIKPTYLHLFGAALSCHRALSPLRFDRLEVGFALGPFYTSKSHQRASSGKTIVRIQAAFHSCLLMCVAASHNAMQSGNVVPPPWAVIDAASLWRMEALEKLLLSASAQLCKEIVAIVVAITTIQRR